MKKLFTILAATAAMFAGAQNASAQYTAGSEVSAGTDYFLFNIGAQKFLTDGMDWGTHATVDNAGRVITLADTGSGKYSIFTKTFTSTDKQGFMTTNGYLDTANNDANWEFSPASVEGYTNVYTIKNSESQYLVYDAATTKVNVAEATRSNADYWIIVPKTARDAAGEVTYLLQNTDFNRAWERAIWEGAKDNKGKAQGVGGSDSNRNQERYNMTFDVYQTVANVENGKYKFTCQGFYRNGTTNDQNALMYINNTTSPLKNIHADAQSAAGNGFSTENNGTYVPNWQAEVSTVFDAGYYQNEMIGMVTDGTLRIGFKKTIAVGADWTVFDNIRLYYLGVDLSDYEAPFNEAKNAANAISKDANMNAVAKQNLETAIANYASIEFSSFKSTEEISEAISALNNAAKEANTSIEIYSAIAAKLATLDNDGQASFNASEIGKTYVDKTYTNADCTEAFKAASLAQKSEGADLTMALVNPSFEQDINTGWEQDGSIKLVRQGNTSFGKEGTQYAEFWQPNGTLNLYQTIEIVNDGRYKITARVKARSVESASIYANATSTEVTIEDSEADYSAEVNVAANGTIKFGFTGKGTGVAASWIAMDNFRLTYVRPLTDAEKAEAQKTELASLLAGVAAIEDHVSEAAFDYNVEETTKYNATIAAAKAANESAEATLAQVNEQIEALKALQTPSLNAPSAIQGYNLVLKYAGWEYDGKTITPLANNRSDQGLYNLKYQDKNADNTMQIMYFAAVEGVKDCYNVWFKDADNVNRYICTKRAYGETQKANFNSIRTTTDASFALSIKVERAGDVLRLFNTENENYIGSQDAGVYTVNSHIDFVFEEVGSATAISTISTPAQNNGIIYDVYGRKLNGLQKGINIVNGMKVIKK